MPRDAKMKFYTTVKLGPNREKTHDGFLLCKNVVISRTGEQVYRAHETPVTPGPNGLVIMKREASEVFAPRAMASFNGKSVVIEHPDDDVTPANYRELSVGTVLDPRRGEGDESDCLVADFLITDPETIEFLLNEGEVEVSCGYDAEHVEDSPGHGRLTDIVGNHVAIVEAGRCGSRCSIRDSARKSAEGTQVAKTRIQAVRDSIMGKLPARFRTADGEDAKELEKALDSALEEHVKDAAEGGDTHIHVGDAGTFDSRFAALDARVKDLEEDKKVRDAKMKDADEEKDKDKVTDADEAEFEKEADDKEARKTADSAPFESSFQETVALAEVIAPGITIPTFDSASKPKRTLDVMCSFRRKALGIAALTPAGATLVSETSGKRNFTADSLNGMSCGEVRTLFNAVGASMKALNRAGANRTTDGATAATETGPLTAAEENKRNADFWAGRS